MDIQTTIPDDSDPFIRSSQNDMEFWRRLRENLHAPEMTIFYENKAIPGRSIFPIIENLAWELKSKFSTTQDLEIAPASGGVFVVLAALKLGFNVYLRKSSAATTEVREFGAEQYLPIHVNWQDPLEGMNSGIDANGSLYFETGTPFKLSNINDLLHYCLVKGNRLDQCFIQADQDGPSNLVWTLLSLVSAKTVVFQKNCHDIYGTLTHIKQSDTKTFHFSGIELAHLLRMGWQCPQDAQLFISSPILSQAVLKSLEGAKLHAVMNDPHPWMAIGSYKDFGACFTEIIPVEVKNQSIECLGCLSHYSGSKNQSGFQVNGIRSLNTEELECFQEMISKDEVLFCSIDIQNEGLDINILPTESDPECINHLYRDLTDKVQKLDAAKVYIRDEFDVCHWKQDLDSSQDASDFTIDEELDFNPDEKVLKDLWSQILPSPVSSPLSNFRDLGGGEDEVAKLQEIVFKYTHKMIPEKLLYQRSLRYISENVDLEKLPNYFNEERSQG